MVLYDYDSNAILAEPMKSHSEAKLVRAYSKLHAYLTGRSLKTVLQNLEKKAQEGLKQFIRRNGVNLKLVPPHCHHQNAAEEAIKTSKEHFIASLTITDKNPPLHLW